MFSVNSRQSRSSETGSFGTGPSSSTDVVHDRLKPPVSAINMERKVIKLSGSRNTSASSSVQTQNGHRLKQLPNKLTSTVGDSSTLPSNSSQKIRLGQPGVVCAVEKPQQLQNVADKSSTLPAKRVSVTAEGTEKKKFKATAITWP